LLHEIIITLQSIETCEIDQFFIDISQFLMMLNSPIFIYTEYY